MTDEIRRQWEAGTREGIQVAQDNAIITALALSVAHLSNGAEVLETLSRSQAEASGPHTRASAVERPNDGDADRHLNYLYVEAAKLRHHWDSGAAIEPHRRTGR